MSSTTIPTPGQLLGVAVDTQLLLVNGDWPESTTLILSGGDILQGCASVSFHLEDDRYGRAMKKAVVDAVSHVNQQFGVS